MAPTAEAVIQSIDALRVELKAEKVARLLAAEADASTRRRQLIKTVCLLAVAGLLTTVGAAVTTGAVVRRAAERESITRARANCEAGNAGARRALTKTREALDALISDPEREAMLSPEQRAAVQRSTARARRIGAEKLSPEPRDCAAEFPSP